jgi:hypothetical protein
VWYEVRLFFFFFLFPYANHLKIFFLSILLDFSCFFFFLLLTMGGVVFPAPICPLSVRSGFIFVRFYTEITAPTNNSSLGRGPTQSFLFTAEVDR